MKRDQIIKELSHHNFEIELGTLNDYCLNQIYKDYIKLKNLDKGYNVELKSYKRFGSDSFSYEFIVLVNTIDHPVVVGRR